MDPMVVFADGSDISLVEHGDGRMDVDAARP